MSVPLGFASVEEWEQWKSELNDANARLRAVGEQAEKRREQLLADAARGIGGGILGTALPSEVRDALALAKRIESFLPFLPDTEIPGWASRLVEILSLVARALGV